MLGPAVAPVRHDKTRYHDVDSIVEVRLNPGILVANLLAFMIFLPLMTPGYDRALISREKSDFFRYDDA
jgi:hypothetical protein